MTRPIDRLLDLSGRVALVTGAARNIGAAVAERLGEAGAAVAVHYRSDREGAWAVASRIEAAGSSATPVAGDLTVPVEMRSALDRVEERLGLIDLLVNNAAAQSVERFLDLEAPAWAEMLAVTLGSVGVVTRLVAERLVASRRPGTVVNVASIEGLQPAPGHAHYATAKAGVLQLTRAAALELGPHGIRVNAVSPGLVWREGLAEEWPEGVTRWMEAVPGGRLVHPTDVADACLVLSSEAARCVTGANLVVDGGMLTRPTW
ncbi:MAG: SDR family NAD(P)-dependent oxidoreductase [Acidimicrobiia bacterium]